MRGGLIRSAHSANFKTELFGGGDASHYRAIDLDQCDRIAIRIAYKREESILAKTEECHRERRNESGENASPNFA